MLNLANRTLSATRNGLNLGTRSLAAKANFNNDSALVRLDQARQALPLRTQRLPILKRPSLGWRIESPHECGRTRKVSRTTNSAQTAGGRGRWTTDIAAKIFAEAPPVVRPVVDDDRSTDRDRSGSIRSHYSMRMDSRAGCRRGVRASAGSTAAFASRPRFGG